MLRLGQVLEGGSLSDKKVLDLLDAEFVNAWILHKDLVAIAESETADPELRRMAKQVRAWTRKHVLMPVGIQVVSPAGELLAKASVNRDRLFGRGGDKYYGILKAGLDAAKR